MSMEDWGAVRDRLAEAVEGVTSDEYFVEVEPADIRAALERVEKPLDAEHTTSCGHTWTMRHTACPECFAALRQRVEELEQDALSSAPPYYRKWQESEAKLARCVEALGEIRGRCLAAKTHEVGPLEAKGRLTRILELACAALAAAKGDKP